jgi:hypothetical protein
MIKMPAMLWDELTRLEQRLLIRLFGGGSLRNQNAADIEGLRRRGLVDDELNLSIPGLMVFTLALREQQANAARRRTGSRSYSMPTLPPKTSLGVSNVP